MLVWLRNENATSYSWLQTNLIFLFLCKGYQEGFPGGSVVKNPPTNAGDTGDLDSICRLRRSSGGGHGNPLQYSYLENPMDRGGWQGIVHRVAKSQTWLKWLSSLTKGAMSFLRVEYELYLSNSLKCLAFHTRNVYRFEAYLSQGRCVVVLMLMYLEGRQWH